MSAHECPAGGGTPGAGRTARKNRDAQTLGTPGAIRKQNPPLVKTQASARHPADGEIDCGYIAKTVKLSSIVFDEAVYPRRAGHDPATVQIYARDLEQIEAAGKLIAINRDGVLLDGRHRMLAYKTRADGADCDVPVYQYPILSPLESFRLACSLQDKGRALSDDDRQAAARRLYAIGDQRQKDIAAVLGVNEATVGRWLSRTIKEEKERKRDAAFAMWLACATQDDIAKTVEVERRTVGNWEEEFGKTCTAQDFPNSSDFEHPLYNVWKQQVKTPGVTHPGNTEPRWLENLLYLYTRPGDIVVDPFAGGGSTIDVCRKRGRRYFVSDRKPIVAREHEIRRHDLVTDGMPKVPRWKDVRLVYLDPPYWAQAAGEYSDDPSDLGNMPLDEFTSSLADIIRGFARKVTDAHIALVMQPTQWRAPDRQFTDHVLDMARAIKLPVTMRYSVPYESQQCTAQMVEWAKANRRCLVLTREIIVWQAPQ